VVDLAWGAGRSHRVRRWRSPGFVAVVAITLIGTLAACGPRGGAEESDGGGAASPPAAVESLAPPDAEVSLTFWTPFTGPDGPFMQTLVDEFNAEDTGITVEVTTQAEYYQKLRTAAQSDTLPDVGIVHLDAIPQNAEDGIIQPINDLIELQALEAGDFTEAVWANGEWKGDRYGVPLDIHPLTFYWNKAAFEEAGLDPEAPPNSEEDFVAAAQALNDAGYTGPIWSNHGFSAGLFWASLFYQGGGEWTNEDYSEATYNSEAGLQAAQFMKGLIDDGLHPAGVEVDAELPAFLEGDSGMIVAGPWQLSRLAEGLGDDLGAGPVPQIFGEGVWAGSHHLAVMDGVEDDAKQAAYYFIDWITSHSTEWAKAGQVPARASVRDSEEFTAVPHIPVIAEQVDGARFFPPFPASGDLLFGAGGANEAVVSVLAENTDPQSALDESAQRFTQIITETKEKYGY
jgi:multiple sugar transport system substrate-binding protein